MLRHRWILALAFLLILPAASSAQTSATESGHASATVEQIPITLLQSGEMNFGTFAPWGLAGLVTVHPLASPATTGSNVTISSQGFPARFTVTGTPHLPFTIVLPADRSASVSIASGQIMVIDLFFSSYNESGVSPVLNASGTATFTLGAKLLVNPNQPPGVYTGSFPLTVAY